MDCKWLIISYACMHDLLIYDYSCSLIFRHLALTTFWNYRSTIASADCFDRYYRLSDFHTSILTLFLIRLALVLWSAVYYIHSEQCITRLRIFLLQKYSFNIICTIATWLESVTQLLAAVSHDGSGANCGAENQRDCKSLVRSKCGWVVTKTVDGTFVLLVHTALSSRALSIPLGNIDALTFSA